MNMVSRPNVFIVGAPRSGSTALHDALSQHPDICMSRPKEPNFFCRDFWKESDTFHGRAKYYRIRKTEDYYTIWRHHKGERIVGESSTAYLASTVSAKLIHDFNPSAKIVILLRNPVDLLISLHTHLKWLGVEPIADFEAAISMEGARRSGRLPKSIIYPSALYYSNRVKYREQIQRFRAWFPERQIKIIIAEELWDKPREIYRDVFTFLGVREECVPECRQANERVEVRWLRFHRLLLAISRGRPLEAVNRVVPVRRIIYRLMQKNTRAQHKPLRAAVYRRLNECFQPEIADLEHYLGRSIRTWWIRDREQK